MIIEQAAQQLPPMNVKMLLKLGVREPGRVRPIKEADQRLKPLPAGGKRRTASRTVRRATTAAPAAAASSLSARPAGRTSPPEA